MKILKLVVQKIVIYHLFNRYVQNNEIIKHDIDQTVRVRGSRVANLTLKKKFGHLMLYYPEFAFIFFWRIGGLGRRISKYFTRDFHCKIFRSTKIEGGLMCYHPFATVINARSIGKNFQFRNGLTIGNKSNDNRKLPLIGNDVSVGAQVVIIGDITIGDNVMIGAGSVVVKDIPSNSVVAGNPAKIIKTLNPA
ncbi:MAG: serine acetyltransferase [Flavobacteriaceae bacterium]|nr:serine acetyltransferase [Flavobacteriaceae bacterium]